MTSSSQITQRRRRAAAAQACPATSKGDAVGLGSWIACCGHALPVRVLQSDSNDQAFSPCQVTFPAPRGDAGLRGSGSAARRSLLTFVISPLLPIENIDDLQ